MQISKRGAVTLVPAQTAFARTIEIGLPQVTYAGAIKAIANVFVGEEGMEPHVPEHWVR
jgi:hypothetical protein